MEKSCYKLVVKVEVEGLGGAKEMDYSMQSFLTIIDKYTLSYSSEEDFFSKKKERIRKNIKKEYEDETGFPPTDINLRGIYVVDENHEMRALFQTIKYKEKTIALRDIILKKMQKGSLYFFYEFDKKRFSLEEYDSFFKDIDSCLLERIELNCCTCADIISVWNKISSSQRIVPLIRILLLGEEDNYEKKFTLFCERVPSKEDTNNAVNKKYDVIKNTIRYPYVEK